MSGIVTTPPSRRIGAAAARRGKATARPVVSLRTGWTIACVSVVAHSGGDDAAGVPTTMWPLPPSSGKALAEPSERQCPERQPEVPKGDVEVRGDQQQVEDDPTEPDGDEIAANARLQEDDQTGE